MNLFLVLKIKHFIKLVQWLLIYRKIYFDFLCFTFLTLYFHYHLLFIDFPGNMTLEIYSCIRLSILILIDQFAFIINNFGHTSLRVSLYGNAFSLLYLLNRFLKKWNLICTVDRCVRIQIVICKVLYNWKHLLIYFEFVIDFLLSECVQVERVETFFIFCFFVCF